MGNLASQSRPVAPTCCARHNKTWSIPKKILLLPSVLICCCISRSDPHVDLRIPIRFHSSLSTEPNNNLFANSPVYLVRTDLNIEVHIEHFKVPEVQSKPPTKRPRILLQRESKDSSDVSCPIIVSDLRTFKSWCQAGCHPRFAIYDKFSLHLAEFQARLVQRVNGLEQLNGITPSTSRAVDGSKPWPKIRIISPFSWLIYYWCSVLRSQCTPLCLFLRFATSF